MEDEVILNSPVKEKRSFSGSPIPSDSKLKLNCPNCKKSFTRSDNLKKHVKVFHPSNYEEFITRTAKSFKYKCGDCHRQFNDIYNLKKHEKTVHMKYITPSTLYKCPLCNGSYEKNDINSHFESDHDLVLKTETIRFNTYEEFFNWKLNIEKETLCFFKKDRGIVKREQGSFSYFSCHRSGFFKSEGKGIRKLKVQGSKRINALCPAKMKLCQKAGECVVTFQSTHAGHENELAHIRLPIKEKRHLAAKRASNVPFEAIQECADSYSKRNMCKHACTKISMEENCEAIDEDSQRLVICEDIEEDYQGFEICETSDSEGEIIMKELKSSSKKNCTQNLVKRQHLLKEEMMELIKISDTPEKLKVLENSIYAIKPKLQALDNISGVDFCNKNHSSKRPVSKQRTLRTVFLNIETQNSLKKCNKKMDRRRKKTFQWH